MFFRNIAKLRLMIWKNFTMLRHSILSLIAEFTIPLIICVLVIRLKQNALSEAPRLRNPKRATCDFREPLVPGHVGFSPQNQVLDRLVRSAIVPNKGRLSAFKNAKALENGLLKFMDQAEPVAFGIQFEDKLSKISELPDHIEITLRFPSEQNKSMNDWRTEDLVSDDTRSLSEDIYERSNVHKVLKLLTEAIILQKKNATSNYTLCMWQYPKLPNRESLFGAQEFQFPQLMTLCFMGTCMKTAYCLAHEKEMELKEAMKIMGLPSIVYILAWFIRTIICYVIISLIIIALFCINILEEPVLLAPNPLIVLLFLLLLSCSFFAFAYLASTIFSRAKWSGLFVIVTFLICLLVFQRLCEHERTVYLPAKMVSMLLVTMASQYGLLIIFRLGLQHKHEWSVFMVYTKPYESLTLIHVMLMLVVDTIIYVTIAAYLEALNPAGYGMPRPWYFIFTRNYWCPKRHDPNQYAGSSTILDNEDFEQPQGNMRAGIKIKNLSKSFKGVKAVKNLYLDVFENEITILMGHNGCGKTTTMNMICGMIPPSEGTAIVNGYDVRTNLKEVQNSIGFCPQRNVLFNELTVMQHLFLFGQLKGLGKIEINEKIQYYLEILELEAKRNEPMSKLSGGMKRKLSIAIAMIADSKIIMLDEPTSSLDPAARRTVWRLLEMEKQGRTILLTTHMMDEADAIGDRIAIMSEGGLHCWGTGFFLKKRYGIGYNLVLEINANYNVYKITEILQNYIPKLEVNSIIGTELSYLLPEEYQSQFESMLGTLEDKAKDLGIDSFGISVARLDDVFMKIANERKKQTKKPIQEMYRDISRGMRASALNLRKNTAFRECYYQFLAMFMKKSLTSLRAWLTLLAQICVPVTMLLLNAPLRAHKSDDFTNIELTFKPFKNTIISLCGHNTSELYQLYKQEYNAYNLMEVYNTSNDYLHQLKKHYETVREHYQFGAEINETTAIAWYSGHFWHSSAVSFAALLYVYIKAELGENSSLKFINDPLPYSLKVKAQLTHESSLEESLHQGLMIAVAFFAIFCVHERVVKVKHLQITSGANLIIFWVCSFLWDFLIYLVIIGWSVLTLNFLQDREFRGMFHINMIIIILFCFGMAVLPFLYFVSKLFQVPSSAFVVLVAIGIVLNYVADLSLRVASRENTRNVFLLQLMFFLVPSYASSKGLDNIVGYENQMSQCKTLFAAKSRELVCKKFYECCNFQDNIMSMSTWALGMSIMCLMFTFVIFSILLIMSDYGYFDCFLTLTVRGKCPVFPADMEEDVFAEMDRIQRMPEEEMRAKYSLAAKCLTKYYRSDHPAVNGVYLGVQSGECFGLLGVNGAGKTTTFMMLTGDVEITYGEAYIMGDNFKRHQNHVKKHIGYCPQFDAVFDYLTPIENITIFCLIRGIAPRYCKSISEQLAQDLDFYEDRNRKVKDLSGGNRRKLNVALAILGDPMVIFLDEPTANMDPATKRFIWAQISKLRERGKCIILTSHSMEECEALCTKVAIMVNGNFNCIGSTQHLKTKFGGGYALILKMKKDTTNRQMQQVDEFVRSHFKNALLSERHQLYLSYHLPDVEMPCSKIFGLLESVKDSLALEDYSVGQSRLEEVFLTFTQYQL